MFVYALLRRQWVYVLSTPSPTNPTTKTQTTPHPTHTPYLRSMVPVRRRQRRHQRLQRGLVDLPRGRPERGGEFDDLFFFGCVLFGVCWLVSWVWLGGLEIGEWGRMCV